MHKGSSQVSPVKRDRCEFQKKCISKNLDLFFPDMKICTHFSPMQQTSHQIIYKQNIFGKLQVEVPKINPVSVSVKKIV